MDLACCMATHAGYLSVRAIMDSCCSAACGLTAEPQTPLLLSLSLFPSIPHLLPHVPLMLGCLPPLSTCFQSVNCRFTPLPGLLAAHAPPALMSLPRLCMHSFILSPAFVPPFVSPRFQTTPLCGGSSASTGSNVPPTCGILCVHARGPRHTLPETDALQE